MGTISLSLPSDGQTIDASDVNTPFNTISSAINGNLDDTNIVAGANINGSKLLAASVPGTALDTNIAGGWITGVTVPTTVTANGNRSYSLTVNTTDLTGKLTPGMRLKLTRTVAAPTQCTSLNGTTQYYSKISPAGMTFTNNFVVSAWVKLTSYATTPAIASRYNGTSGWIFDLDSSGRPRLSGYNAGVANTSNVLAYQSIPLNKWVHIAAQLDMATFTATTTTSYVMIDGVDVPASVNRGGTNPTALIQAGNLEIGGENGGSTPFPGKIAQVAIYSAKVTEATILASMHQALVGTETSLISAYSFNNSIVDLNANANNLTANGSAVATNADTPFGQTYTYTGYTNGSLCYGIVQSVSFSTNTTVVVQVPEGDTIPTSGGVSAISYSTVECPYGFPSWFKAKNLGVVYSMASFATTDATGTAQDTNLQLTINVPAGAKDIEVLAYVSYVGSSSASLTNRVVGIREGSTTITDNQTQGTSAAAARNGVYLSAIIPSPTAGSHTYKLFQSQNQVGTQTLNAGATEPIYVMARIVD